MKIPETHPELKKIFNTGIMYVLITTFMNLVEFCDMLSSIGIFHAYRLGNHGYCTFLFTFLVLLFLESFSTLL